MPLNDDFAEVVFFNIPLPSPTPESGCMVHIVGSS